MTPHLHLLSSQKTLTPKAINLWTIPLRTTYITVSHKKLAFNPHLLPILSEFTRELKLEIEKFQFSSAMLQQKSQIISTRLRNSDAIRKQIAALQRKWDFLSGMGLKSDVFSSFYHDKNSAITPQIRDLCFHKPWRFI